MQNKLKAKLLRNEKALGTMSQLCCQVAVECLGISGLDFFIIDMEHTALGTESMRQLIVTSEKFPITPLVRIPLISRDTVMKALDSGAGGLIIPAVETPDQVRELLRFAKYPNEGSRGFSMIRTASYGYDEIAGNPDEYFRYFNEETLIIPQCETRGCLDNIEEIISIPGVDGIFIGPYDLSTALGHPADFNNPVFKSAVKKVLDVSAAKGKFTFMLSGSAEETRKYFDEGFSAVVYSLDINVLINGYKAVIKAIREKPEPQVRSVLYDAAKPDAKPSGFGAGPFAEYLSKMV